ncbi:MAG: DUF4159 domain-containing protein [Bradymonadaceae bacterium]
MDMNRRQFLLTGAALGAGALYAPAALAMGESDRFTIGHLRFADAHWNPRPTALRRLLLELEKRTSVEVLSDVSVVDGLGADIFDFPFLIMAGDRRFDPWPEERVNNLRTYLQAGGFLFIDSAEGVVDGPFATSVEREMKRIFPRKRLTKVPRDHVLHKSFYLVDQPVGRINVASQFEAIFDEDRLAVVVSHNDILGALARDNFGNWEYSVTPGGERQREMAYRLGINIVMYALTVNYKSDQVHIPFILRRRRWRVD